jgi:hypothetical protein
MFTNFEIAIVVHCVLCDRHKKDRQILCPQYRFWTIEKALFLTLSPFLIMSTSIVEISNVVIELDSCQ